MPHIPSTANKRSHSKRVTVIAKHRRALSRVFRIAGDRIYLQHVERHIEHGHWNKAQIETTSAIRLKVVLPEPLVRKLDRCLRWTYTITKTICGVPMAQIPKAGQKSFRNGPMGPWAIIS